MKILHYCKSFSKLTHTFIYDAITELETVNADNLVLTYERYNQAERPFPKVHLTKWPSKWTFNGILDRILAKSHMINNAQIDWQNLRSGLRKELKTINPDIVHAHFGPMGVIALPVAVELGIPLVVSFHGLDAFGHTQVEFWKKEYQKLYERASGITVVSNLMKEHFLQLGCPVNKVNVIHVGKKLQDYPFVGVSGEKIRNWVSIGRLIEKKGYDDCIKAFAHARKKFPDIELKIIGSGKERQNLRKLINHHNLENHVELLGELDHAMVKEILINSDAFILCSKEAKNGDREGIPTVLMEAQAMGKPCISTWHSGIPEIFPRENHWLLAEEGNIMDIVKKIETLLLSDQNKIQQLVAAGRKKIEEEFDINKENLKQLQIYQQILN